MSENNLEDIFVNEYRKVFTDVEIDQKLSNSIFSEFSEESFGLDGNNQLSSDFYVGFKTGSSAAFLYCSKDFDATFKNTAEIGVKYLDQMLDAMIAKIPESKQKIAEAFSKDGLVLDSKELTNNYEELLNNVLFLNALIHMIKDEFDIPNDNRSIMHDKL